MDPLKFTTERHEKYVYIRLEETKLTTTNAPQLKSEFVTLNAEGRTNIILDLSQIEYADSSGLSSLLVANRLFNNAGGIFILCGLTEHVQKLVDISHLDNVLNIVPTKQEGIEAIFMKELQNEVDDDDIGSEIASEFGSLTTGDGDD